jgi:hypothetical protein
VPYGDTRFGDLRTVRTLVGSIIPFTGIAGTIVHGGITIEQHGMWRALRGGKGILKVARELGVGSGTVQRVRREMTGPFADVAA